MPTIHLTTFIAAPKNIVFDLNRHIGLRKDAMSAFGQEAVAGTRFGLINMGETVTWRARHFFKNRMIRLKVSEMKPADYIVDEQVEGDFRMMRHEHYFKSCDNGTIMIDLFHYESPYGILGRWFNNLYLNRYVQKLLEMRNRKLKETAESDRWRKLLDQ